MARQQLGQAVLYSYRRCPYAMRARMALRCAGIPVEIREISLRDKPPEMLALSPKGTVPVLHCADGQVIEQSLDIMRWALKQNDPQQWLRELPSHDALINVNDTTFKHWLDRYKYAERYPEFEAAYYREQARTCQIEVLEKMLSASPFLGGDSPALADVAIFPFVRQFAAVDAVWFAASPYQATRRWLEGWIESALFKQIMAKSPPQ
ncbi:glutathione S-transferase [Zwartia sp.]|uniref:glutathione S-transferase n=1 Tax=Zwartia sp. TaxID=2978004 RepID=UPI002716FB0D|nr:glutathione S-transferase [Zwartia sp.]MDO9024035.1 glutathione S-transferase [Zwartia sp.]